mgnify:CR=1 FL=1
MLLIEKLNNQFFLFEDDESLDIPLEESGNDPFDDYTNDEEEEDDNDSVEDDM